jgi:hypothetical protein
VILINYYIELGCGVLFYKKKPSKFWMYIIIIIIIIVIVYFIQNLYLKFIMLSIKELYKSYNSTLRCNYCDAIFVMFFIMLYLTLFFHTNDYLYFSFMRYNKYLIFSPLFLLNVELSLFIHIFQYFIVE